MQAVSRAASGKGVISSRDHSGGVGRRREGSAAPLTRSSHWVVVVGLVRNPQPAARRRATPTASEIPVGRAFCRALYGPRVHTARATVSIRSPKSGTRPGARPRRLRPRGGGVLGRRPRLRDVAGALVRHPHRVGRARTIQATARRRWSGARRPGMEREGLLRARWRYRLRSPLLPHGAPTRIVIASGSRFQCSWTLRAIQSRSRCAAPSSDHDGDSGRSTAT